MKNLNKLSDTRTISKKAVLGWCDEVDDVIVEFPANTTSQNFTDDRQEGNRSTGC